VEITAWKSEPSASVLPRAINSALSASSRAFRLAICALMLPSSSTIWGPRDSYGRVQEAGSHPEGGQEQA
jgi:hypothetical protein